MRLHENKQLFLDAVAITAEYKGLPEIYIEKDYWVTLALRQIFESPMAAYTVFKGGTALSKCFTYINRFSEDIDLVVVKDTGVSANRLKDRLKQISNVVSELIPEVEAPGIINKKGMIRKTVHSYSKTFDGDFGQVRDVIILETSWLGSAEPTTKGKVSSYIYEMMLARGQGDLAAEYGLLPFDVSVLAQERTLCEKIMSLVRFSHTATPVKDLRNKIRHVYDLHQMLAQRDVAGFFDTPAFDKMLHKVGQDDEESFRNNKDWLYLHPSQALIFSDIGRIWSELASAYNGSFRTLVFGEYPSEDAIKQTILRIAERLGRVQWEFTQDGDPI